MRRLLFIAVVPIALYGCAAMPLATFAAGRDVPLHVTSVALDSNDPNRRAIGSFMYAGGIEITGANSHPIHELSDLRVLSGNRLIAVSDRGTFFEARLVFDQTGRLSGLTDAREQSLVGERGQVITAQGADAEGLDLLPDGARLVSFERDHRIWLYPADGSAPRAVPRPDATFPANEGMEGLTLYPSAGEDAYLVGGEVGSIWLCHLKGTCEETGFGALVPPGFGLTALAANGKAGDFALLARSYDPQRGVRIVVRFVRAPRDLRGEVLDEMTMAPPLTVDNFEGLALAPRPDGSVRMYLLSDDNGSATQRTYLLAFDWRPR